MVCRFYGVEIDEITRKRRARKNEERNAATYLSRKLRLDTYKEIGNQYGVNNYRTVRSVFVRMKALSEDKDLAGKMIEKSQEWT